MQMVGRSHPTSEAMIRDEFERLLSDWLDEPLRADLREVIENAAADNPELAAIRDAWRRVHGLTWDKPIALSQIDWERSALGIAAKIDAEIANSDKSDELNSILKLAIAPVELSVDWMRFSTRVSDAIDASVDAEIAPGPLDGALRSSPAGVAWKQERERIAAATHTIDLERPKRVRTIRLVGWTTGLAAAASIGWLFIRSLSTEAGNHAPLIVKNIEPESRAFAEVAVELLEQTAIESEASVTVAMAEAEDELMESEAREGRLSAAAGDFYFSIAPVGGAAGM